MTAKYCAELVDNTVIRVIVAPDLTWCEQTLGGTWVETIDPYVDETTDENYAGIGMLYRPELPERFISAADDAADESLLDT